MRTGNGHHDRRKRRDAKGDRPAIWIGYGKLVKLHRERSGLTQQQLAEAMGYSVEQVASVEQGRRPAKDTFTEAAERALDARGTLSVLQDDVDLAKLPSFFVDFALIEAEAVSRFSYDPLLIPGLLQTEEYARAVFTGNCPPLSDELIEQHVEARLSRQKLLTRAPAVNVSFIIEERVLLNAVGGRDVLLPQLRRLLDAGAQRNVEIQVMPSGRGFHPGLNGPMVLLETLEHQHVAYLESHGVGTVVTDPAKVSSFSLRCGKLRSQALNAEESARLIDRLAGEA
ncbi:helix-turn-helix transcriptional regulator [Streptomyces sp. F63]|uniref:helix-turn-helix domain-containing protein n=1 Tax=Streptomyces sp. F63 TaxID=2824887 RepID=UPI001B3984F8|nr:helix-turn-helix transcriptional regulator [Streptomyces sp. F63]MBQ0985265.1 helix-turn-helix transcriptional regulator [Streptomyces sp. F63]